MNYYHGNTLAPTLVRLVRTNADGSVLLFQPSAHPRIRYRKVSAASFAACYFTSPEAMAEAFAKN